jgi:hypothetical protein
MAMEWISVQEDLPNTLIGGPEDYPVYPWAVMYRPNHNPMYTVGAYDHEHYEWFLADYSDTNIDGVTHWMLLDPPQAPEPD